jgi:hypothetical protein
MPAHNILFTEFTPDKFEVQPPTFVDGATRVCLMKGYGAHLRRMDAAEDRFVPWAQYRESWIILPNWKAAGNQGLYGFQVNATFEGSDKSDRFGGSLSYQLSNDNGVTWLYHNGVSWVAAGLNWNTAAQVDYYVNVFPLTAEKQVRVKVRMTPGSQGKTTPYLNWVTIYADLEYDFQVDLLRSMKEWLERHIWIRASYYVEQPQPTQGGTSSTCVSSTSSDIIMIVDKKWEELSGPAEVYNLTTDPNRTTNLFAGFVQGGIQLTSAQTGYLEAHFFARPPVYLSAEEFMQLASIPSIVVQLVSVKERRDLRRGNPEVDYAVERRKAKIHMARVWFDAEFRISCQSDLMAEATRMSDAVDKALTYHQFVLSQQTGEVMPVPYATPLTPANRIAQGLYVREYACTLFGKAWLRTDLSVEEDLAQKIRFFLEPAMAEQTADSLEIMEVD